MSEPTPPTTALAKATPELFARPVLEAFRRGDRDGLLASLGIVGLTDEQRGPVEKLALLALETRRQSVSVLGNHEAFVRMTKAGSLYQVIQPVRLSLADKTIYQIPIRKCFVKGTDEVVTNWRSFPKDQQEWREVKQTNAEVTYQGYLRINGVAGCAVGQPPSVIVDGQVRTNPFVQRTDLGNGRLGDIIRIVLGVCVVGPAPATGNPVVVNYSLDYDPSKDLQHMLSAVADKHPAECFLVDESDLADLRKPGWKYTPVYQGVGYLYNLKIDAIREVYADFVNLLQNAGKKVQTIARRNAMKSHPALAIHTVEVDTNGRAVVAIVGWAGDEAAMGRWRDLSDRLSKGMTLDVESIEVETEVYDPEKHRSADVDEPEDRRARRVEAPTPGLDPELEERNRLIEQLDAGMGLVAPAVAQSLGYKPETATVDELRKVLGKLNAALDADGA